MQDAEALAIMRAFADGVKTYDQVVEKEAIRDCTVNLFNQLRAYSVGVLFLQTLNHFQRYSYVRQAHAKERRQLATLQ